MDWIQKSYSIFIYLGIFFFISHFFIYGSGFDISYFGLLLMYIGYFKTELYNWFFILLWVFIGIEIFNMGKTLYTTIYKRFVLKKIFSNLFSIKKEEKE